jgi:FMN phosphatase YigB (HAD superfamily)
MTDWPKISAIISDLDGVTYRGDDPIESAVQAFQKWYDNGFPYAFVTNNSTKSAEEFADKLNGMGIPASPERIVTTSAVAADRLTTLVRESWSLVQRPCGARLNNAVMRLRMRMSALSSQDWIAHSPSKNWQKHKPR